MSVEREKEKKINCSVHRGKQTHLGEMKGKQRKWEAESGIAPSDERGNHGEISVYSINFANSGC